MPVIAVINRKGGSGKSTMATHLAAWLANEGRAVMLGDVDRQQSTRVWLKRREEKLPKIVPWAQDQKNVLKVPAGVTHVVLDTPGGMHGFDLARAIMSTDAVLMPVCNSLFDRESAASCIAELMTLPRVSSGRCKLAIVGMRLDARTKAAQTLREWADSLNVPFLGVLRETQLYVKALDSGVTLFDQVSSARDADLAQWEPILDWLRPIAKMPSKPVQEPVSIQSTIPSGRAASLMPAQGAIVHGDRLSVFSGARLSSPQSLEPIVISRSNALNDPTQVPHFLQHH
jgi:chromosome partitioning protein